MNGAELQLIVRRRQELAEGVIGLELYAPSGQALPTWTPGAHIDIATHDATGRRVFRAYSLCGPLGAAHWQVALRKEPQGRGGSAWLHASVGEGDRLAARGPRNHFELVDDPRPVRLFAGGIGITPLLPMARQLQAVGRAFRLDYHVRSRRSAPFLAELMDGPLADHVSLWADDEAPPPLARLMQPSDAQAWVYTCGPTGYMAAIEQLAALTGIPPSRVRRESFAPAAGGGEGTDLPFVVRLQSTGLEVRVEPGQSVVQALEAAGRPMLVSCEQGYCGSCLTRVVEGTPDHRDQFLSPEEQARNDCFTPCCSRSLSPCLVLDL